MGKMLGEGTRPVAIDYTFGEDAWRLAQSNINAIRQLTGTVTDVVQDRKADKDAIKVGADKIDAVAKLFGDDTGAFAGIADQLKDEEIPLSQRAGLARQIDSIAGMAVDKFKADAQIGLEQQRIDLGSRRQDFTESVAGTEMSWAQQDRDRAMSDLARQDTVAEYMARPVLSALGGQIAAMERQGLATPVTSDEIKALYMDDPKNALAKAGQIMAMLPAEQKREMERVPVTIDGQPGEAMAYFDEASGSWVVPPVVEAGSVVEMVKGFEGFSPTPYGDFKQNSIGYGTRAQKGDTRISEAEAEARLVQELSEARDEVILESGRVGLPLSEAQIDALTSFHYNTGSIKTLLKGGDRSPEEIADAINLYNKAGGKVLPGLVKRRAKESALFRAGAANKAPMTANEREKEELELQKLRGEAEQFQQEAKDAAIADAEVVSKMQSTIDLTRAIEDSPGFSGAVGAQLPDALKPPGSDAMETIAMIEQLKGKQFLDAVKQMKGMGQLSDAEGRKLEQASGRLERNMSEEAFKRSLQEIRETLSGAIARRGGAAVGASEDKKRSDLEELINGR